jgi:hypothetical protein
MGHTREPWKYTTNVGPTKALIVEPDGSTIMECGNATRDSRFEANAARICAAVNACAGIDTDKLTAYAERRARLNGGTVNERMAVRWQWAKLLGDIVP